MSVFIFAQFVITIFEFQFKTVRIQEAFQTRTGTRDPRRPSSLVPGSPTHAQPATPEVLPSPVRMMGGGTDSHAVHVRPFEAFYPEMEASTPG